MSGKRSGKFRLKVCLAAAGHEGDFKKDDDGHKASKTVEKEQSVFEEVA